MRAALAKAPRPQPSVVGQEQRHAPLALPLEHEERTVVLEPEKPGLFAAAFPARELGLHTLRAGELTAFVSVGPANPRELSDVFSNTELLRPVAEATGGSVRRLAGATGGAVVPRIQAVRSQTRLSGADWIGIRPSDSAVVRGVSVLPLALGFLGAALLIAPITLLALHGRSLRVAPAAG